MRKLPRLLFSAPASGGGKTTVVCALLQALKDAGYTPVAFKCGPDYIDPMFHSEVIGARSRNLDLFLMGEPAVKSSLLENGGKGDLCIIEGAMGYYDGIVMSGEASAFDLAVQTDTPAVLVLDGRGRALSAAALVKGFLDFRPDSHIRGVVLNRISARLYPRLKAAVEAETGLTVYGFLPDCQEGTLESRHLGLVTAAEVARLKEKLSVLAELAGKYIDWKGLLALADSAPALEDSLGVQLPVSGTRPRIAIARDKAFCFYYADALALLEKLGAELVDFSPLTDAGLPEGVSGLYLGGGYPELYAQTLSENLSMCEAVRTAMENGMPTVAECGGFLYLHDTLEDDKGQSWPMCGVFHAAAYRTSRLSRFGYITLTAEQGGLLGAAGQKMPAHEFHYWESSAPGSAFYARKPQSERNWVCAYHTHTLYAGFPHFHFYAVPEVAARFVVQCGAYHKEKQQP